MSTDSSDKTEKPSQQKLKKAREQGQVVRSRDLATAIGVLASLKLLFALMPGYLEDFGALFQLAYAPLGSEGALDNLGSALLSNSMVLLLKMVAPLMVVPAMVILGSVLPGGFVFNPGKWAPDFSRLNPLGNLARLASPKALSDLGVSLLKAGCLIAALIHVCRGMSGDFVALQAMSLDKALVQGADLMVGGVMTMVSIFLLFAVVDVPLQSYFFTQSQRMSKQEMKEEHKGNEGRPEVKQRIRSCSARWRVAACARRCPRPTWSS